MIIKNINIISFGKLKNKKISFSENFNVIYGKNESGKTTASAFIEAMLYSFPPRSDRSKYLPWDNSTAAGEMTVNINEVDETFYRRFGTQPKGDILEPKDFSLKGHIPPDRDSYRKSSYSPEGGMGNFGTTDNLDSVISNLLATGDENIGAKSAVKSLEKLRRSLNSGGKLKAYENKISQLENEYAAARLAEKQYNEIKAAIYEKERLIKEYEDRALKAESDENTSRSDSLKRLDLLIASQEEYLKTFPSDEFTPPQKPVFVKKGLAFYIICTILLFVAGFFINEAFLLTALLPPCVYFSLYMAKSAKYKSQLENFFSSAGCVDEAEYNALLADKAAAEEYYTSLLKEKSDLVTHSAVSGASDILYRKILTLRRELDNLKSNSSPQSREPDIIASELSYFKALHKELTEKLEAIRVAIDGINYAKDIIATDFAPKVTEKAMGYLNRIAPKEGRSASLSRDLTLTVSDTIRQPLLSQSFGFREEMYLCFRIAWSDFLFGNSFPLIIDDPFLGSDDYRENALIDLLYSLSKDRQIIIFTNRRNNRFHQLECNWVDISL